MSSVSLLSEKIVEAVGTGEDPAELVNLTAVSGVLGGLNSTLTAAELNILDGVTATAAELNSVDLSVSTVLVPTGGGAVVLPASGGTVLIPLVTSNITATLPVATLGLTYEFIFVGSAADAEDWVISCPAATLFAGGIEHLVTGAADIDPEIANGSTENTLTVNNPTVGTAVRFIGMGAGTWGVTGFTCGVNIAVFSAV